VPEGETRIWPILEEGLAHIEEADLDEKRLLRIVDAAQASATSEGLPEEMTTQLDRNLRRAVYEYLLALDAATVTETAPAGRSGVEPRNQQIPIATDAPMIGIEEVNELGRATDVPPPAQGQNHRDLIRSASAAVESVEAKGAAEEDAPEVGQQRHRFSLFRRNPKDDESVTEGDATGNQGFAVASREGFHIGHPTDLLQQPPTSAPADAPKAEPAEPRPPTDSPLQDPPPQDAQDAMETMAAPLPVASPPTTAGADITQARRTIDDRLRRKRCDEAAALLQQLAHEVGGREVAELAVDAGDRCRGLGKRRAATNSYLAAARSDPVFPTPLLRLADICIDDKDIDLAVSYLERVARLSRLSGDLEGALRVYRKIAAVAPYREDVLELLLRAQTTGRIDS
jgi:hypothetical protein